jgi:hypothetical protein
MVQNGPIVTWPTASTLLGNFGRGVRRPACGTVASLGVLLALGLSVPVDTRQATAPVAASGDARARLDDLRRQADDAWRSANVSGVSATDRRESWRRLAAALDAMASDDSAGRVLRDDLILEARRTAEVLRLAADNDRTVDGAAVTALLDRLRRALGDIALGLSFQGSYSQTRAKEQVYGGHASAMGPAPAAGNLDGNGAPSPVTFHEHAVLSTRTWNGGLSKDHILESPGNGVALVDVDGDGWLDIYLVTAAQLDPSRSRIPHRNALYRNLGNWRFEDISAAAGVDAAAWGSGVCAGDADGDGRLDLYVTNWGPNFLFRNKGDGRFEDIAATAGVAAGGWSTGCTFFDADADGDLDLYVARYVSTTEDDLRRARRTLRWRNGPSIMVGPAGLPGEADLFFENLGGGRFREAAAAHGLADAARAYGFGVVATDVDDDGAVDLFVANDSNPNFLYRNLGNGRFDSVGLMAGVAVNGEARAQAGMGADAGDADGDGRVDLVLTAFAHDRNTLYRNLGSATFEDATLQAGLATITFQRMGWGIAFLDADLDGQLDLFIANGHIFADVGDYPELGETFAQKNQFLLNAGATFRDVSATAGPGLAPAKVSRGLAVGDIDNDGDPDVVISNMDDTPTLLENRQATGHHWISLQVTAPTGNRLAIGARVTVTAAGRRFAREIRSGSSFMSQGDLRLQIGLGGHAGPVDVDVRLPGGARWEWHGLTVDRLHALVLAPEARLGASSGASR